MIPNRWHNEFPSDHVGLNPRQVLVHPEWNIADLQISNSIQSNQNLERLYLRGVVRLFVRHV